MTVSQKSAYWVTPPGIQSVPYAPIKEIDFVGKKRKVSKSSNNDSDRTRSNKNKQPSEEENYVGVFSILYLKSNCL